MVKEQRNRADKLCGQMDTAERVFWVPPEVRWQNLKNQAARDNPNLKGKLLADDVRWAEHSHHHQASYP